MDFHQEERELSISTPLGDNVLVVQDMIYQDELARPFEIQTTLLSLREDIAFEDLLGQKVSLRLMIEDDQQRYFHGYITQFRQRENLGPFAVYQATITPWIWFLSRTADCRIFQHLSIPEIIKQVFRDLGFSDFKDELVQSYPEEDYRVQYRETDFQFVHRLMEEAGIYYYFEHHQDKHILVLCDSHTVHQELPNYDRIPYHQEDSTYVGDHEHVYQWLIQKQIQPGQYTLKDFDFKKPRANLKTDSADPKPHEKSDYEIYDYPGKYDEIDRGEDLASIRLQELQAQYEQFEAASNVRGIATGYQIRLKDHPRPDQNKKLYLITRCRHWMSNDIYYSGKLYTEYSYDNQFSAIDAVLDYRPPRRTPKPVIKGPQTAIVVGPAGEEIYTDEHGRVKLQFHWDRYGKSDENSSCWVRVSQLWAGKNWGGIHLPRIGQEVIVDFLEGDPDRPIVTGRVYNAEQVPPYDLPANKTQSGIKSRSSKNGSANHFNEIRFEDKKGQEELYIHAEKNQTNIVENDEYTEIGHDRTELVKNDEKITIEGNRTERVVKDERITIEGDRTERVHGNENIQIDGDRTEKVEGDEKITIAGNRTEKVKNDEKITIAGDRTERVEGHEQITVKGNQTTTIEGNEQKNVLGNSTEKIVGQYSQMATAGINMMTPAQINMTATAGYNLNAPAQFFTFTPYKAEFTVLSAANTVISVEAKQLAAAHVLADITKTSFALKTREAADLKQALISLKNSLLTLIK